MTFGTYVAEIPCKHWPKALFRVITGYWMVFFSSHLPNLDRFRVSRGSEFSCQPLYAGPFDQKSSIYGHFMRPIRLNQGDRGFNG